MVIVKIHGGLGNQMFEYAAAKAIALKTQQDLYLNCDSYYQQIPNTYPRDFELPLFSYISQEKFLSSRRLSSFYQPKRWDNRLMKILGAREKKVYKESRYLYDPKFEDTCPPVLLDGYFQSEKYFLDYSSEIRTIFKFSEISSQDINYKLFQQISSCNSVSVHVRRSDYVDFKATNEFHGTCSIQYYLEAIGYIQSKVNSPTFFFFSDDQEWVRLNLASKVENSIVVTGNSKNNSWKDMYLMSTCKHNIIANSTFSWWGAWLNASMDKIVIAPNRWFATNDSFYEPNDIVPLQWIKI